MEYFHRNDTVWFATPISNVQRVLFRSNPDGHMDRAHLPSILAVEAIEIPESWWPPMNYVGNPMFNPDSLVEKERHLVLIMMPNDTLVRLGICPNRRGESNGFSWQASAIRPHIRQCTESPRSVSGGKATAGIQYE